MRREILRATSDTDTEGHTIYFQISNGIGRFACCVIANVPTREGALQLFQHNLHRIEEVATPMGFARDPKLVWSFYNARRANVKTVQAFDAMLEELTRMQKHG